MKKLIYILLFYSFFSCQEKDRDFPVLADNLANYINNNADFSLIRDSLIACAFGGQEIFLLDENKPISILFYPEGVAAQFQYFESENEEINPDDLEQYTRQSLSDSPVLNGYLHRFERPATNQNLWGRITYVKNRKLYISNAIRIKYNNKPTEYNQSLVELDQTTNLAPLFTWSDGLVPENAIYFQAIADLQQNLISGTYTFDKQFQFYDLSNVVLNIKDTNPPPTLLPNTSYQFIMMGVSEDNWVNLILEKSFKTN